VSVLVLQDKRETFLGEVAAGDEPLVVLLDQQRAGEADQALIVGEDADDVGAAADLAVDALERVRAAQLGPVLAREAIEGQQVLLGALEQFADLGRDRRQALEHGGGAFARLVVVVGVEDLAKLPERHHRDLKARWWQVFDDAGSPADARRGLLAIVADYRAAYPSAMAVITDNLDALVAHLRWPTEHRKRIRPTNLLERTFVEVRRRTKVIGRFPGETSALSLIWAVLELSSRGWRGVVMTPRSVAEIERLRRRQHPTNTEEVAAA
jgi:hypothetical protein